MCGWSHARKTIMFCFWSLSSLSTVRSSWLKFYITYVLIVELCSLYSSVYVCAFLPTEYEHPYALLSYPFFFVSHEKNMYCIYMKINRCLINSSVQAENNLKNSAQATTTGKRHAFASNRALRYSRLGESVCANGVAAGELVTRGRVALLVLVDENTRPEFYSRGKKQPEVQLFPDSSFLKSRWAKNIHPFEQKVVV